MKFISMQNTYGIGIMSPFTFSQVSHFLYELKSCSTLPDMSGKVEQDFRVPSKVPKYFFSFNIPFMCLVRSYSFILHHKTNKLCPTFYLNKKNVAKNAQFCSTLPRLTVNKLADPSSSTDS